MTLAEKIIVDGFERVDLPGATLWHGDDNHPTSPHTYWAHNPKTDKKGKRLTGMTTVIKPLDFKPDGLMKWAAKTNLIGVAELFAMQGAGDWIDSHESIWAELERFHLTYDDVKNRAADRGTSAHTVFEQLARGETPDCSTLSEEEAGHAAAILDWWSVANPEPILVEQIVCDPALFVAGRLDLYATVNGADRVIDLKTGYVGNSAHVQTAGYRHLLAASGLEVDEGAAPLIIQTTAEGEWKEIEGVASGDDFTLAVNAYRAAGRIEREGRKARV